MFENGEDVDGAGFDVVDERVLEVQREIRKRIGKLRELYGDFWVDRALEEMEFSGSE